MPSTVMSPAERVRDRMQRWLDTTKMGQRDFAADLHKSQVWLQKILKGENQVRLRDLDLIATAMRSSASELVRAEDDRRMLELTPTEVMILERLRHRPRVLHALMMMLDLTIEAPAPKPARKPSARVG